MLKIVKFNILCDFWVVRVIILGVSVLKYYFSYSIFAHFRNILVWLAQSICSHFWQLLIFLPDKAIPLGSYLAEFGVHTLNNSGNKCLKGDVTWQKNYPFLGKKHKKVLFLASPSFLVVLLDIVLLKLSKNGFQIMKIEELIRSFE